MADNMPEVVEAQRFVLRDASGKIRAELSAAEDGTWLLFHGPHGEVRVALGVHADGEPALHLCDGNATSRAGLSRLSDGAWALVLAGPDAKGRVGLTVESDGATAVMLIGPDREVRAQLVVDSDGTPSLVLWDREGNPRTVMEVRRDGTPAFALYDKYGRPRWSRPRSTEHTTTEEKLRRSAPRSRAGELGQLTYDWWLHRKAKKG